MTTMQVEKKSNKVESQAVINIADLVADEFYSFPKFTFVKTEYSLISPTGYANIKKHIIESFKELPLTDLDSSLLNDGVAPPQIVGEEIVPAKNHSLSAVAGDIKMKELPAQTTAEKSAVVSEAKPSMAAVVTGSRVEATGLCQTYFAAMSSHMTTFAWNAATQVPALAALTSKLTAEKSPAVNSSTASTASASSVTQPQAVTQSVCMKDELVEGKLSHKAIAVAVQHALLPLYSDEQLLQAMIDLHNNKAPFTIFLRENSNKLSELWGKDTHSWTQAVKHIREEAQRRLAPKPQPVAATPAVATSIVAPATDQEPNATLHAVVGYDGSFFSSSVSATV